jgi:Fe-S cluster biogenesis protein NfuA
MPDAKQDHELREKMKKIDSLLHEIEQFKDAQARTRTREIVKCLLDLHGAVLERMLDTIASTDLSGTALIDHLSEDDPVSGLMLLYGLHPLDLETRVLQALEKVRPYLHSHGGNVELLGIEDTVVRLRLHGSCHGCPSSAQTLKNSIEEAIAEKAPDVTLIRVEGETAPLTNGPAAHSGFALPVLAG